MALSGNIREDDWTVEVETRPDDVGGFRCRVRVEHSEGTGRFRHEFEHGHAYPTEREAVLAGLRAGMTWIELKRSQVFNV
ncbi:UDP-glucose 4-epimerase [Paraburkholderia sp. Se-20369]|nr:UDP-glucose 4-epimerase [Paraburkholderia sp. Se-20369]TCW84944.1 UDP-glucose 4-epimerase [Burkholderia sp. SRS-46]